MSREQRPMSQIVWWAKIRRPRHISKQSRRGRNHLGRERGQSLVEFDVILPLVLMIVLATVDLGMGFRTYIALTNAAREGVRWISIYPDDQAGAEARIAQEAERVGLEDGLLVEGGYEVRFVPDQSDYAAGDKVTVNIDFDYELLFGSLTGLPAVPFTASSTMVVLYD